MAKRQISLINGCCYTEPSVHPKNWNTKTASLDVDWYIHYTFTDPEYSGQKDYFFGKKREQIWGLAGFKILKERQDAVKALLEDIKDDLEVKHWNPISERYMEPIVQETDEEPAL